MIEFKEISLEDKPLIESYQLSSKFNSYSYCFSSLYFWRKLCKTTFSIIDGSLIILKHEEGIGTYFMMPLNYTKDNLEDIVKKLKLISMDISDCKYLFGDVEDFFIYDLQHYTSFPMEIINDRNDYEYIYNTSDLIKLSGKKYHSKRNHYKNFINNYSANTTTISSKRNIEDCMTLLENWHRKTLICSRELEMEKDAILDILINSSQLDLNTIAIYVKDKLIGFSIGEKFKDTAIIHVERCDNNYNGVYSYINKEFLVKNFSDTTWVNRQEDCGDIGLRNSKESYHPNHMISKSLLKM